MAYINPTTCTFGTSFTFQTTSLRVTVLAFKSQTQKNGTLGVSLL